jgi:uncharacterized damage-inducible protein DinB
MFFIYFGTENDNMITTVLIDLYTREIDKLKNEILAFESDELLWRTPDPQITAAGNHCLYIAGTLQHFIGNMIGDSGYIRNKEAEMKARNVSRERLLEEIDNMKQVVVDTLEQVSKTELQKQFPTNEFPEPVTTEFYLIHLLKNLGFHLGQVSLLRQLVSLKIES